MSRQQVVAMIDFIIAGILYIALLFVVFFVPAFVTVGIVYSTALGVRRLIQRLRCHHQLALK